MNRNVSRILRRCVVEAQAKKAVFLATLELRRLGASKHCRLTPLDSVHDELLSLVLEFVDDRMFIYKKQYEDYNKLVADALRHALFQPLQHLLRTASESEFAAELLATTAVDLVRTLNRIAKNNSSLLRPAARRSPVWPILKSFHPDFTDPKDTKGKAQKGLNELESLLASLQLGQDNYFTKGGKGSRATIRDPLGKFAIQLITEIDNFRHRGYFFRVPTGEVEDRPFMSKAETTALALKDPTRETATRWAEAVRSWAKEKYGDSDLEMRFGHLIVSRSHQNRKLSKILDRLSEKVTSLLGWYRNRKI